MRGLAGLVAAAAIVASAGAATPPVPAFDHVFVLVFENKEQSSVIASRDAPTFTALARRYAQLTQYYGVSHPSLPNYLALVSGSTHGITSDCTTCAVSARNLADTLAQGGMTWKLYAEGLPRRGFTGPFAGRYAKKHAPFLYFQDVLDSSTRLNRVVPLGTLRTDLRAGTLPDFSLVVPDLCHSMHDCSVATGDAWLKTTVAPLLRLPRTAVFVVFDEGTSNTHGGGHVAALVLGTAVRPHSSFRRLTSHYGLLRTIEDAWRLPRLGLSARAAPIVGIWR